MESQAPDTQAPDTRELESQAPDTQAPEARAQHALEQQRLAQEEKNERHVWWFLAYFLFGIHIVAFVMIYAVTHAK
ncbi:hypothetical protein [Streptomyces cavernae]|uniref:hypothetical protein n=1 Tax=Streptomyces cavernae TaxID=2259034 RepID=UPI003B75BD54